MRRISNGLQNVILNLIERNMILSLGSAMQSEMWDLRMQRASFNVS